MRNREQAAFDLLVLSAQSGQAEAFARLAQAWQPRLFRHACRLTGDREAAREVVQDAWLAIIRGLPRLRDPACFGSWAFCITGRRSADWIRRRQSFRRHSTKLETATGLAGAGPAHALDRESTGLRDAIRRLAAEDRLLLTLFYLEEFTVPEIAAELRIPPGTVKSRLFTTRARLRALLEV